MHVPSFFKSVTTSKLDVLPKKNPYPCGHGLMLISDPGTIRTCDLLIRSQLLYPAELRGQNLEAGANISHYILLRNICMDKYCIIYLHTFISDLSFRETSNYN